METKQAVAILDHVCGQHSMNRADHMNVQAAVQTLKTYFQKVEAEEDLLKQEALMEPEVQEAE